jgi:hypothetical protein
MVLAFIVNKTRQSPERSRIPAAPLSAFTSPGAGFRERLQFEIDLRTRRSRKLAPLANGG